MPATQLLLLLEEPDRRLERERRAAPPGARRDRADALGQSRLPRVRARRRPRGVRPQRREVPLQVRLMVSRVARARQRQRHDRSERLAVAAFARDLGLRSLGVDLQPEARDGARDSGRRRRRRRGRARGRRGPGRPPGGLLRPRSRAGAVCGGRLLMISPLLLLLRRAPLLRWRPVLPPPPQPPPEPLPALLSASSAAASSSCTRASCRAVSSFAWMSARKHSASTR